MGKRQRVRQFLFDETMESDFDFIKKQFSTKYKHEPSNNSIFMLLMQTYKESNPLISRKNKSKRCFIIEM